LQDKREGDLLVEEFLRGRRNGWEGGGQKEACVIDWQ